MAYYIVHKRNPYFKNGTIIELFEDGFQECVMETRNNRMRCLGNRGLIFPEKEIFPYCIKMLRKGFDDPKLRRKSGRTSITPYGDVDVEKIVADYAQG